LRTPSKELGKIREQFAELTKTLAALGESGVVWKTPSTSDSELILAGNLLIAGGADRVDVIDVTNGKKVWTTKVNGEARGLAVANGHLIVSTTQGNIHIFETNGKPVADTSQPPAEKTPPPKVEALYQTAA